MDTEAAGRSAASFIERGDPSYMEQTKSRAIASKRRMSARERHNTVAGYLFLVPFLIGLFVFTIYPFVYSLYLSFTEYSIVTPPKWIGLDNFVKMFTADDKFWISFVVTIKFALVQVPLKLIFSLLVAVLLSAKTKLTNTYRAAFYIPSLLGGSVAVAITWVQIWRSDGVVNKLLSSVGLPTNNWLKDPKTALYVLVLLGVWQFGSQMLIFLAGIKDVPQSLHEAAIVDGAGPVKRFFKVTLPMLTPCIFFNLINGIIGSMQAFGSAFLVTQGGPMNSTLYYALYQYNQAFSYLHMGYASAMAWFLMIVIVLMTALVFRSSAGWVYYQDDHA